ncbi:MAG: N utilization substance protein B [Bacillota bacterium]|nr:MAG: N utilization substance protein B [Bacillota bacterium]MBS3951320.1 transcription antitermination factor NusB [Peptococcaceae bacterium]
MSRRTAREAALQTLYQLDLGLVDEPQAFAYAMESTPLANRDADYARRIVRAALSHWEEINAFISNASVGWTIDRLARVDISLLRLSLAEMLSHDPDTPINVVINEGLELAKQYSTEESSRFINGMLGNIARQQGWVKQ